MPATAGGVTAPGDTALAVSGRIAVVLGNWLEFYDFLVFTLFAVMIGDAFFPGASAIDRLLADRRHRQPDRARVVSDRGDECGDRRRLVAQAAQGGIVRSGIECPQWLMTRCATRVSGSSPRR